MSRRVNIYSQLGAKQVDGAISVEDDRQAVGPEATAEELQQSKTGAQVSSVHAP